MDHGATRIPQSCAVLYLSFNSIFCKEGFVARSIHLIHERASTASLCAVRALFSPKIIWSLAGWLPLQ